MKPENILEVIDEAVNPALARRKHAARAAAHTEQLSAAPPLSHASLKKIAEYTKFEVPKVLVKAVIELRNEWQASYSIAIDHQHDKVRAAYEDHEREVKGANSEMLRSIRIRSVEDFKAEFMHKMKVAHAKCARIAGEVNVMIQFIRLEFADTLELLAEKVVAEDEARESVFGVTEHRPSPFVWMLRKAAHDIRVSAPQISMTDESKNLSIADLVARK